MATNILPLFWPLANSSKDTRLTASASLVSNLENFQSSFISSKPITTSSDDNDSEDEEEEEIGDDDESGMEVDASDDDEENEYEKKEGEKLDRRLGKDNAEDVVYCVKRLIRGLGSSRESSRLGFAVTLTELLSRIQTVSVSQVLSLLIRNSQYSKNMKGSDERDMMFARLFGLTSIIQSNSLYSNATATLTDFEKIVDELVKLGEAKAWMRESAWWTLVGAVKGLIDSEVDWKAVALQETVRKVLNGKSWNQEKVALVLLLEGKVTEIDWKSYLSPTFKHTPLLNSHNLVTLGRVLKEASAEDDDSVAATTSGNWKPQLHFVWNIILEHYFPKSGERTSTSGEAPFQDFFRVVVDESLFSNTASPQRRYWGFQVFERSLPRLSATSMPLIFTPNFMRCWMNNLSSSDRYLHKAALQIAKKVQEVTKENSQVGFTLLSQLVGKHGRPDFDKVTKTKTVESIMGSLNVEGTRDYVKYLQEIIVGGGDNSDAARVDERRLWALDQILALTRNGSVPKDDEWISSIIDLLLVHGFFLIRKADKKSPIQALHVTPKPALSEATAATCRSRLSSCLVELTTASVSQRTSDDNKPTRQQGCDVSGRLWLRRALDTLSALEKDNKHVEITTEADEEIIAIRTEALVTLSALDKVSDVQKETAKGAEILLAFFVLQTYDEVEDALDLLENANSAIKQLYNLPSTSNEEAEDDEHAPIDSLLDVLIALLDKGSNDLRNLANLVFGIISPSFTESSINLLTAQLEQTVADAAAESSDDDDDEDEDEDAVSDNDDEDAEDDDDDEEVSEVEEDDEDDLPDVDPAFRQRVAEALNVAGLGVDDGDNDNDDEDSDEEEYMDDDQMMKVDEQLAEVFRQQAASTKKTDLKHLQIESLHFKNRILDFFDVYCKKQSANPLILSIIIALLRLVRGGGSSESELANKAAGILRSKFNKPKEVPSTITNPSKAIQILKEVHGMAIKAHSAEFSNLCSLSSLFIVKSIESSSSTNSAALVGIYSDTLKDFMTRKSSLVHHNFILEFIKRFPSRGFELSNDLIGYVEYGKGVNAYRQLQGFSMLQIITQHLPSLKKSNSITGDKIEEFISHSRNAVFSILENTSKSQEEGTTGWNAAKLKDVVKFTLSLARTSKNLDIKWDLPKVQEIGEGLQNGEKTKEMKGVISMWNQLIAILGGGSNKTASGDKKKNKRKNVGDAEITQEKMDVDGEQEEKVEKKKTKKVKNGDEKEEPSKKKKKVDGEEKKKVKKEKKSTA